MNKDNHAPSNLSQRVCHKVVLAKINNGFDALKQGNVAGVLVVFDQFKTLRYFPSSHASTNPLSSDVAACRLASSNA
jgi:hypothetical protein